MKKGQLQKWEKGAKCTRERYENDGCLAEGGKLAGKLNVMSG